MCKATAVRRFGRQARRSDAGTRRRRATSAGRRRRPSARASPALPAASPCRPDPGSAVVAARIISSTARRRHAVTHGLASRRPESQLPRPGGATHGLVDAAQLPRC
ncbi:hypothetical protein U9M48_006313 [Paspalum notatum var. saurae]|uniref:Uncharacterized protein n=1 Tax=Paspalum notatum var. saurae TaxID=547442 RepID=A0AAQ3PRY6_PASNO